MYITGTRFRKLSTYVTSQKKRKKRKNVKKEKSLINHSQSVKYTFCQLWVVMDIN